MSKVVLLFFLILSISTTGCNLRRTKQVDHNSLASPPISITRLGSNNAIPAVQPDLLSSATLSSKVGSELYPDQKKFEDAQKKEREIDSALESANQMFKTQNLEGALRLVQRIALENSQDPYVIMRTSYLEAMIYNKMKDASKRKEAMNRLLKSMENLQSDPRFQQGFLDGLANQEVIKMSLEKAGKKYGP